MALFRGFAWNATLADVTNLANKGLGRDPSGYRAEFLELVAKLKGN